jgi:hypothetical protein
VSVLFALVASLCAAVVAALFVAMWLDGDGVTTTALAVALLPVLVLTMLARGEAPSGATNRRGVRTTRDGPVPLF